MDARTGTEIALLEEKRSKGIKALERKKKKLREDLAYLRSNKLDLLKSGAYTPDSYIEEENKLRKEIDSLMSDEQTSEEAMHETMKDVQKLSELIRNLLPIYNFANPQEKEQIIRILFSELHIEGGTLYYSAQIGVKCLEDRFQAVCDPTENRTPVFRMRT